jgi:DNA processing protein
MKTARSLFLLSRCGASAASLRNLLADCGDADAALAAGPVRWREYGMAAAAIAALRRPDLARLEADLLWQESPGHHVIGWQDPDYPGLLRSGAHPPAILFVRGDPSLLWHPQIAVVGSRGPSAGGRDNARAFASSFGRAGFTVTSGLAQGIDTAAHQGAMAVARTIAVLGTGPDQCFPPGNAGLMEAIAENGAVVTEHPPGTPGLRQHFPSRNRLIAGLALATVVVEAAVRSGALITARLATDAGREVFAIPGSIHNPMARGCHRLIREGAGLVESPDEVLAALAPMAGQLAEVVQGRLSAPSTAPAGVAASGPERMVWRALGHDPVNIDQLCQRTGLTVGPLSAMLLAMELDGKISAGHGRYSRRS